MTVTAIGADDPGWQPVADDVDDRSRREVEQHDVGLRNVGGPADAHSRADLAAEVGQHGRQRVGDCPRAAFGYGPAVAMTGGDDRSPDGGRQWPVERLERVSGDTAEQRSGLVALPTTSRDRGWQQNLRAERRQADRVSGQVQDRLHQLVRQLVVPRGEAAEGPPPTSAIRCPQTLHRPVDRTPQQTGVAVVERMGAVDLRPSPREPVTL